MYFALFMLLFFFIFLTHYYETILPYFVVCVWVCGWFVGWCECETVIIKVKYSHSAPVLNQKVKS